jgi:hypothetical protein
MLPSFHELHNDVLYFKLGIPDIQVIIKLYYVNFHFCRYPIDEHFIMLAFFRY